MDRIVGPAQGAIEGVVSPPGDKSVSHRAVIFAAAADGTSRLKGILESEDVEATIAAVSALGAGVERDGDTLSVTGWGATGPTAPDGPIDCGNSGTTVRLLSGLVAGWPIAVTFTGDVSLSRRPMDRVADPLSLMGAAIELAPQGTLPMTVRGGSLTAIAYNSPVASAQVKSCVLLAGLRARGRTSVTEPAPSRDHTERMLPAFGVEIPRAANGVTAVVEGPAVPTPCDVNVPSDPSSAAFFAAATAILPGSRLRISDILLNPTRTAALDVLERMGATVCRTDTRRAAGEEVGDVTVEAPVTLVATHVGGAEVPALIDEIPILAVTATQAVGTTRFDDVGELRVKESDRLAAVSEGLASLGASVRTGDDWLEVDGPTRLHDARLPTHHDHRLAMAYHVAALVAEEPVTIEEYEVVAVSYPEFAADLETLLPSRSANASDSEVSP